MCVPVPAGSRSVPVADLSRWRFTCAATLSPIKHLHTVHTRTVHTVLSLWLVPVLLKSPLGIILYLPSYPILSCVARVRTGIARPALR